VRDSEQWAEPVELDVTVLLPNDFRRAGHPKLLRDFSARLDFIDFRIANLSRAVFLENFVLSSRSGNILIEVKSFVPSQSGLMAEPSIRVLTLAK
jgi:hypothetical protein